MTRLRAYYVYPCPIHLNHEDYGPAADWQAVTRQIIYLAGSKVAHAHVSVDNRRILKH